MESATKSRLTKRKGGSGHDSADLLRAIHSFAAEDGMKLSPIDFSLRHSTIITLPPISWVNYHGHAEYIKVTNTGFTAIVSGKWDQDRPFVCSGPLVGNYLFSQIHFHWGEHNDTGSEHAIDGIRYPLEMHVVHYKKDYMTQEEALTKADGVAIMVHLFAVQEKRNPILDQLTAVMQFIQTAHSSAKLCQISLAELVQPFDTNYYLYWGAVSSALGLHRILWFVSRKVLPISSSQLDEFRQLCNVDGTPLKKNSSDPYPLQDRTLFLVSPETQLDDTVYGVTREPTRIDIRPQISSDWDIRDAEYKSLTGVRNQVSFQKPRFVIEHYDHKEVVNTRTVNIRSRQEHTISSKFVNNVINIKSDVKFDIHLSDIPCGKRVCSPHVETTYFIGKVTPTSESVEQSCVNLDKHNFTQVPKQSSELTMNEIRHEKSEFKKHTKKQNYDGYSYNGIKSSQSLFDIRESRYKTISIESNVTTTQSDVNMKGKFYLRETDPSVEEACVILELTPTSPSCYRSNTYVYLPTSRYLTAKQEKTNLVPLKDTSGSSEIGVVYSDEFERRSLSTTTERTLRSRIESRKKTARVPQVVKIDTEYKMGAIENVDVPEYSCVKRICVDTVRNVMNKKDSKNRISESQSKRLPKEKEVIVSKDIDEIKYNPLETTKRKDINIEIDEDETEIIETRMKKIRIRRVISIEGDNKLDSEEKYTTTKQSNESKTSEHETQERMEYSRDDTYLNEESQKVTTYDLNEPSVGEINNKSSKETHKMYRKYNYLKQKYIKVVEQKPPNVQYEINEPLERKTITVYHKTPVIYKTTDRRPHICYRIFEPLTTPKLTEILKVPFSPETKAVPHDSRYQNKHITTKSFPSKPSLDTNDGIRPIQSITYETIERINESLFEEYITVNGKIYRRTGSDHIPSPMYLYRPILDRSTVHEDKSQERLTDCESSEVSLAKPISFILKQKNSNKKSMEPFPSAVSSSDNKNVQEMTNRTVHKDVSKDNGAEYYITSIRPKLSNTEYKDSNTTPYTVHLRSDIKNEHSVIESEKIVTHKVTEKQSRTSKISRRYENPEPVDSGNPSMPVRQLKNSKTEETKTNYEGNTSYGRLPTQIKNEDDAIEFEEIVSHKVTEKQSRTSTICRRYENHGNLDLSEKEPKNSENKLNSVHQPKRSKTEITNYVENTPRIENLSPEVKNKATSEYKEFVSLKVTEKQSRTSKTSKRYEEQTDPVLSENELVSENESIHQPKRSKIEITHEEVEIVENTTEYVHDHKKRMKYDTTKKVNPEETKRQIQQVQDDKDKRNANVYQTNILQAKDVVDIKLQDKPTKNNTVTSFIINNNILPLEEFELKKYRQEDFKKEDPNKDIHTVREVVTGKRSEPRKADVLIKSTTNKVTEPERKAVYQNIKYGMKANEHHSQTNQTKHGVIHEVVDVKEVVRGKIKIFNEVKVQHHSKLPQSEPSVHTIRSRPLITSVHSQSNILSKESDKSVYQITLAPSHFKEKSFLQVPMHDTTYITRYPKIAEDKKLYKGESSDIPEMTSEDNIYEETISVEEERNETVYTKNQIYYKNNIEKLKENRIKMNDKNQDNENERKLPTNSKEDKVNKKIDTTLESDLHKQNLNHETTKLIGNRFSSTVIEEKIKVDEIYKESTNAKKIRKKDDEKDIQKFSMLIKKDDEVEHKEEDTVTKIDSIAEDEYRTKETLNKANVEETLTINESIFEETISVRKETFVKRDRIRNAEHETQLLQDELVSHGAQRQLKPTPSTHSIYSEDHQPIFEIYYGNIKPESEQNTSEVITIESETSKVKQSSETVRIKKSQITEPEHVISVIPKKEINEPEIFIINKLPKDRLIILEALPVESKSTTKITTEKNFKHKLYKVFRKTEASNSKFYFGSAKPPPIPVYDLIVENSKEQNFRKEKDLKPMDVNSINSKVEDVTIEESKTHSHEYKQYKKVTINRQKQETFNRKMDDKLTISKIKEVQSKPKENEINEEIHVETSQDQFSSQDNKSLPVFIETLAKDDTGEDSVVIYIRQEKTPASHIQPTITIDYTKTKEMTVSDLDMQKVCIREMDPTTSQIMSEQSVFPNKSDGKILRVNDSDYVSTRDTSGAGSVPLVSNDELKKLSTLTNDVKSHFIFNNKQPLTVAYTPIGEGSRFKLYSSKTKLVWKNRSMKPDTTSTESVVKPMVQGTDYRTTDNEVSTTTVKSTDEDALKRTLSSKGMCCSEYYPDTDPLSKVFPSTFSFVWPKEVAEVYSGYQSPIRMYPSRFSVREFPKLQFCGHWTCRGQAIMENTGSIIRLKLNHNTTVTVPYLKGGPLFGHYMFEEVHFHWGFTDCSGAEHVFDRESRCMEAHFLHYKKDYGNMMTAVKYPDGIACLSVTFKTGGRVDDDFDDIVDGVKQVFEPDTRIKFPASAVFKWLKKHVETSQSYITYPGSFTLRPFFESVTWIVIVDPFVFCCQQSIQFRRVRARDGQPIKNFRKPQPHNNRPIYYVQL